MHAGRAGVLAAGLVLLAACGGEEDYADGLQQPPTSGRPTQGPGSGQALAEHVHYTLQKNNPHQKFSDPTCPDVPDSRPGTSLTCEIDVGADDPRRTSFLLRMGDGGIWQISSPP